MSNDTLKPGIALITGASSGIGAAFALRLAELGHRVVLVARRENRLHEVMALLPPSTLGAHEAIVQDLAREDGVDSLITELNRRQLSPNVVVFNAGFSVVGPFAETSLERTRDLIRLQITNTLALTHALLPPMIKNRSGALLYVGSIYSFFPVPYQAVYAAAKSFLLSFSLALRQELRQTGIRVCITCPGYTATEFRTSAGLPEKISRFGMSAQEVAQRSVIGLMKDTPVIIPGRYYQCVAMILHWLPNSLKVRILERFNRSRGLAPIREDSA